MRRFCVEQAAKGFNMTSGFGVGRGDSERRLVSTASVAKHERVDFWRDAIRSDLLELDFRLPESGEFDATLLSSELPELSISTIESSASVVERHRCSRGSSADETFMFNFVFTGRMVAEQDGRTVVVEAGDGVMCTGDRPYVLRLPVTSRLACVRVPSETLRRSVAGLAAATATSFSARSELCAIVSSYASHLADERPALSASGAAKVARNFTDLLLAMAGQIVGPTTSLSEPRSVVLVRVKDYVERHLGESDLDAANVAAAMKLSHRYINRLFEAEDTSLARYIWRRRLERAARDLEEVALRNRGISQIALSNGFNDMSHFSKVFRSRFGTSPRDFRRAGIAQ
jgi:AraC family transcriptional activator of tynA and feaB